MIISFENFKLNVKKLLVFLCTFSLLFCSSCSKRNSISAPEVSNVKTIKIGVMEPFTGAYAASAIDEINGIKLANWLYNTVTINGTEYSIKLVEADNESTVDGAKRAAEKLVSENVLASIGTYDSTLALSSINILTNAKIPTMSATSTHPRLTLNNDYSFRICPIDPLIATIIANYVYKNGYETAAILTCKTSENSISLSNFFRMAYTKLGGKIVHEQTFNFGDEDFSGAMDRIKKSGAEFIFAPSAVNDGAKIIDASRKAGLSAKVGASATWESAALVASSSSGAEGAIFASFFNEGNVGTTETTKFNKEAPGYLSFNGFPSTVTSNLACGYGAYMAIFRALETMDKVDNEELRFRIDDLNYDGLTGVLRFDENGDAIRNTIYMKEIINKRFALLETTNID
jgi:branched-chain amino acid transport system substrate-binding protein